MPPIPLTGTVRTPEGGRFNGTLRLTLSYSACHDIVDDDLVVARQIAYPIINGALPASAEIVPNTDLQPTNTWYVAEYFSASGAAVAKNHYYIDGDAFDIGSAVPSPITTSNIAFSEIRGEADAIGFLQAGAGAVERTVQDRLRDTVHAEDFGGANAGEKIAAAIASLPSTGGIVDASGLRGAQTIAATIALTKDVEIRFGAATYTCSASPAFSASSGGDLSLIGSMSGGQTILLTNVSGGVIVQPTNLDSLTVERITFQTSSFPSIRGTAIFLAANMRRVIIRSNRFLGIDGVGVYAVPKLTITDNQFFGLGRQLVSHINFLFASDGHRIEGNRFDYFYDAIRLDAHAESHAPFTTTVDIDDSVGRGTIVSSNSFDGGFYTFVEDFANEGAGVNYTPTTLVDPAAAFSGIANYTYVRLLKLAGSGTGTYLYSTSLSDASAHFITNGVKNGDIVRAGSAFGVVENVESETLLWIEEWQSNTDRLPVARPSGAYTVYHIYLGKIQGSTATTITVTRWLDRLTGATVVPSAGTRYEVGKNLANYPIFIFQNGVTCSHNTIRRAYSDSISCFAWRSTISHNEIYDAQDMGITIEAGGMSTVMGNVIDHCGAANIVLSMTHHNTVVGNILSDCSALYDGSLTILGNIYVVENSHHNLIQANQCRLAEVTGSTISRAIYLADASGNFVYTEENLIIGNQASGYLEALRYAFQQSGSECRHNTWLDNQGSDIVVTDAGAVSGLIRFGHTAYPAMQIFSNPNSIDGNFGAAHATVIASRGYAISGGDISGVGLMDFPTYANIQSFGVDHPLFLDRGGSGVIPQSQIPFSLLPPCNLARRGSLALVADANVNTWGDIITAAGPYIVGVCCNGTNWTVYSK